MGERVVVARSLARLPASREHLEKKSSARLGCIMQGGSLAPSTSLSACQVYGIPG